MPKKQTPDNIDLELQSVDSGDNETKTKNKGENSDNNKGENSDKNKAKKKISKKKVASETDAKNVNGKAARKSNGDVTDVLFSGRCLKLRNKRWFQVLVFLALAGLDTVDLISDWLVFRDVIMTEEGLVYGPPDPAITWALLGFSIMGTFTFVFEVINLGKEVFTATPWLNIDMVSALVIWLEDVPQIILNVLIVGCREEAISYFQLVKAAIIIIGVFLRIIIHLVRYCSKKSREEVKDINKETFRHLMYRILIMFGLILLFAGSITIFIFTQTTRDDNGHIKFQIPEKILEGEYDDHRYFTNVSMYVNHPLFGWEHNGQNWLRMASIYDVRERKDRTNVLKYEMDEAAHEWILIWQTGNNETLFPQECYILDRTAKTVTEKTVQDCITKFRTTATMSIILKFNFIPAHMPGLIFGDIKYNIKILYSNNSCLNPAESVVDKVEDRVDSQNVIHAVVHYYRTIPPANEDKHLMRNNGGPAFYSLSGNLEDITKVWQTGFTTCQSTGSLAPHHDPSIAIPGCTTT